MGEKINSEKQSKNTTTSFETAQVKVMEPIKRAETNSRKKL